MGTIPTTLLYLPLSIFASTVSFSKFPLTLGLADWHGNLCFYFQLDSRLLTAAVSCQSDIASARLAEFFFPTISWNISPTEKCKDQNWVLQDLAYINSGQVWYEDNSYQMNFAGLGPGYVEDSETIFGLILVLLKPTTKKPIDLREIG